MEPDSTATNRLVKRLTVNKQGRLSPRVKVCKVEGLNWGTNKLSNNL
jgi:hypothetical protein